MACVYTIISFIMFNMLKQHGKQLPRRISKCLILFTPSHSFLTHIQKKNKDMTYKFTIETPLVSFNLEILNSKIYI